MKSILFEIPLAFLAVFASVSVAFASGACSGHDGVDCSRQQPNGHVVCNDGWTGSSVLYSTSCTVTASPTPSATPAPSASSSPLPVSSPASFSDLPSSDSHFTAIGYLSSRGVVGGYPDGTFQSAKVLNRAELLKLLVASLNVSLDQNLSHCFPDVTTGWYVPYVCYAKQQGWVAGYPDGTFHPEQQVNKAEAIKMLINSQGLSVPGSQMDSGLFSDVKSDQWFASFVNGAKTRNILEENNMYEPISLVSRGNFAENLYRSMVIKAHGYVSFQGDVTDPVQSAKVSAMVTGVVDGDTAKVTLNGKTETLRFIGVNTPETVAPGQSVQCYGKEASDHTKELLTGQTVSLQGDPTQYDRDKYGRLLRYVYLSDGTNLNLQLVSEGYGYEYTYQSAYAFQADFKAAEQAAKDGGKGLWSPSGCNGGK